MTVGVLGPGGVGGLVAAALLRAGTPVIVIARDSTAELIAQRGIEVSSVLLGDFTAHPRATPTLSEPVDTLIVATKAGGLADALDRVSRSPELVVPLLNGLDHMEVLRERFGERTAAGTIRVEADRPAPGRAVHTSRFLRVDLASREQALQGRLGELAEQLQAAGIPARLGESEAQILWSKLVRLNALACTTSAHDLLIGAIRSTPELRAELAACIEEACAVAAAEGARIDPSAPLAELDQTHETLGSSMQRDIAAGRAPELDAIPGSVLRAGARHGLECPTIARLAAQIAKRAGVPAPHPA